MVVGIVIVIGLSRMKRPGHSGRLGAVLLVVGLVAILGATMVVLASSDEAADELLETRTHPSSPCSAGR